MKILEKIKNRLAYLDKLKIDRPIIELENSESVSFLRQESSLLSEIEESIVKSKISQTKYLNWALMPSALRYFSGYVLKNNDSIKVVELGGGRSTFFWDNLIDLIKEKNLKIKLEIETYEHDEAWANDLNKNLKNIKIKFQSLKQISDLEFENFFKNKSYSKEWNNIGSILSSEHNRETRIKNCFYNLNYDETNISEDIDGIIVDGPHGNGRSLAFPLFYKNIKNNAFVLIDDYTHYPFLDDFSKLYNFKVLAESKTNLKKWILLKIISKKF